MGLVEYSPHLSELRAAYLDDLGGEENVPAGKLLLLDKLIKAEGYCLLLEREADHQLAMSRKAGHTAHPSRWKVTPELTRWYGTVQRLAAMIGLERVTRKGGIKGLLDARAASAADQGPQPADKGSS